MLREQLGSRLIALPRTLVDALAEQFTSSPFRSDENFVFAHPKRGSKLEAKWYHDRFQEALATAGVEGHVRSFHDMRHTALTNLAATGASPIAIMTTRATGAWRRRGAICILPASCFTTKPERSSGGFLVRGSKSHVTKR